MLASTVSARLIPVLRRRSATAATAATAARLGTAMSVAISAGLALRREESDQGSRRKRDADGVPGIAAHIVVGERGGFPCLAEQRLRRVRQHGLGALQPRLELRA